VSLSYVLHITIIDHMHMVLNLISHQHHASIVSASINDWLDYKRISTEVESLKEKIAPGEDELKIVESQVKEAKKKLNDDREEEANVKQLQDLLVRLRDDVNKIASKKNQISSKKEELSLIAPRASGKDLRTTERELSAKTDEKETRMNAISALNGELSELMENINRAANQATKANKITRDKEEQFAKEQQDAARKKELNDKAMKNKEQEDRVSDPRPYSHCVFCNFILMSVFSLSLSNRFKMKLCRFARKQGSRKQRKTNSDQNPRERSTNDKTY
jgi:DNA repair exonuclease SbcCD ATPase subunit